jgi:hypothetical protein
MTTRKGAYLVLAKVVREVGDHDLGLGRDAVLGRAALLAGSTGLAQLVRAGLAGGLGPGITGGGNRSRGLSTSLVAVGALGASLQIRCGP